MSLQEKCKPTQQQGTLSSYLRGVKPSHQSVKKCSITGKPYYLAREDDDSVVECEYVPESINVKWESCKDMMAVHEKCCDLKAHDRALAQLSEAIRGEVAKLCPSCAAMMNRRKRRLARKTQSSGKRRCMETIAGTKTGAFLSAIATSPFSQKVLRAAVNFKCPNANCKAPSCKVVDLVPKHPRARHGHTSGLTKWCQGIMMYAGKEISKIREIFVPEAPKLSCVQGGKSDSSDSCSYGNLHEYLWDLLDDMCATHPDYKSICAWIGEHMLHYFDYHEEHAMGGSVDWFHRLMPIHPGGSIQNSWFGVCDASNIIPKAIFCGTGSRGKCKPHSQIWGSSNCAYARQLLMKSGYGAIKNWMAGPYGCDQILFVHLTHNRTLLFDEPAGKFGELSLLNAGAIEERLGCSYLCPPCSCWTSLNPLICEKPTKNEVVSAHRKWFYLQLWSGIQQSGQKRYRCQQFERSSLAKKLEKNFLDPDLPLKQIPLNCNSKICNCVATVYTTGNSPGRGSVNLQYLAVPVVWQKKVVILTRSYSKTHQGQGSQQIYARWKMGIRVALLEYVMRNGFLNGKLALLHPVLKAVRTRWRKLCLGRLPQSLCKEAETRAQEDKCQHLGKTQQIKQPAYKSKLWPKVNTEALVRLVNEHGCQRWEHWEHISTLLSKRFKRKYFASQCRSKWEHIKPE